MNASYNSTDISLYLANNLQGKKSFLEPTAIARNQWPEHQSETDPSYRENSSIKALTNATFTANLVYDPLGGHQIWQVILIVFFSGLLSLVTIIGNILVLVSFKVNKQLKTVNNYFLLSLAFADLIIGLCSMNLYTTYIIMDHWALGNWACDLWLAIDYVASNASVMNLLVISFDRYFSITRPLTYRAKRTTKRAWIMIGLAWLISFVLWAPAILLWQYFAGARTVPVDKCLIPFLSEPIITFCTAIAAFYLPVTIMIVLYWRIYMETENRSKELAVLQASGSRREKSHFIHQLGNSQSCSIFEMTQLPHGRASRRTLSCFRFGPNTAGQGCEGERDHSSGDGWNNMGVSTEQPVSSDEEEIPECHSIFSIVLNLPGLKADSRLQLISPKALTVSEENRGRSTEDCRDSTSTKGGNKKEVHTYHQHFSKISVQSMSTCTTLSTGRVALTTKSSMAAISNKDAALAKQFALKTRTQINKRRRTTLIKEKKAAQTLSAILFAFIITWTPYNIMVLLNTFCNGCIPEALWALGYWLCYVNSTVNPMCYALCNKAFRTTFKMILLCERENREQFRQFEKKQSAVYCSRVFKGTTASEESTVHFDWSVDP
ncbi:muscarinic acetylcholine receptor M3-like [Brienomyrus brachyistius]|uniref:muscarinic acetylcholine receptor M3-like n=1 Tax=Brienomyrus brachyistius TaxID=42636 RepID=UPI0020B37DEE|nr:muscarinic acetylcholine receptor M3-like [Brienomyrus brachyistius]